MQNLKKSVFGLALCLCATLVLAQPPVPPCDPGLEESDEAIVFDLAGTTSGGALGDADNSVITLCNPNLADAAIDLVAWDAIDVEPIGASWCSEVQINFLDAAGVAVLFFTPAVGEGNVGPCSNGYSSGGDLALSSIPLPPLALDAGGCITIEIVDTFDDNVPGADANITAGSITLHQVVCVEPPPVVDTAIPTMGEWGLMCLVILFLIIGVVSVTQKETQLEIAE